MWESCPLLSPTAADSAEVATPLVRQRHGRGQASVGLHPRSSSPRFMALLAAVHQALKTERTARQAGRMATRSKQRRSPAHQSPEASSIGVPPASAACGAQLSSRAALQYHQVFEQLLRTMHPAATAELLQAKTFLASFPCPT